MNWNDSASIPALPASWIASMTSQVVARSLRQPSRDRSDVEDVHVEREPRARGAGERVRISLGAHREHPARSHSGHGIEVPAIGAIAVDHLGQVTRAPHADLDVARWVDIREVVPHARLPRPRTQLPALRI